MRKGFSSAALGLASVMVLAIACTSTNPSARSLSTAPGSDSLAPLRQLESRQIVKPTKRARSAPIPPGLPLRLGESLDDDATQRAALSLAEVLSLDEYSALPDLPKAPHVEIDADDADEAVRSYVLGRAARLAGDLKAAEEELRRAAELDPSAPEIWRELAQTLLALGNRPLATSAFRRALTGSPDDVRSLEYLSTEALERLAMNEAVALLARLREADLATYDPALPAIVAARLGEALLGAGYLTAGSEALVEALELPTQFGQSTNYSRELGRVYRRRASLWVDVGDAALRRSDIDGAFTAYDRAAELPGGDSSRLLARRVLAEMRRGRPASAAIMVLQTIDRSNARVEGETMDLLSYIARHSNVGPVVGRVVAGLAEDVAASKNPATRRALVLAGAAVADDTQAIEILREWLALAPVDASAVRQLLDRAGQQSLAGAVQQTVALIAQSPLELERYTLTLTGADRTPEQILQSLESVTLPANHSIAGAILRARVLSMVARHDEAIELLEPLTQNIQSLPSAAAAGLQVRLLGQRARWNEADARAFELAESADSWAGHVAAALALGIVDAEPEALEALRRAREMHAGMSQVMNAHLLALEGQLSMSLGDYESAQRKLESLLRIDPWRDEVYLILDNIKGLDPDAQGNESSISPDGDSPSSRFDRAKASAAAGRRDVALAELKALELAYPGRTHIVDLLAKVWAPSGDLDGALDWFRARVEERPGESIYTHELTRLLMSRRRNDEALKVLASAWERTPGERNISKNFEALLRQAGGSENRVRANTVFQRRTDRKRRVPSLLLDLAQQELSNNDLATTSDLVVELASLDRPLHPEAAQWIEQQVNRLMGRNRGNGEGRPFYDAVLRMHQALMKSLPNPRFEQYAMALSLMIRTEKSIGPVLELCQSSIDVDPARAWMLYVNAGQGFVRQSQNNRFSETMQETALRSAIQLARDGLSKLDEATARGPLLSLWTDAGSQLIGKTNDGSQLIEAIHQARDWDAYDELIRGFVRPDKQGNIPESALANISAQLATALQRVDNRELVEWLYRDAMHRDPTHLNAHNNLGYQYLTWGEKLEDAQALIETAYDLSKTQFTQDERRAFVTDSLGWARYKLGIMHDEFDDKGNIVREGAVKILRRALSRAADDANKRALQRQVIPVVGDHLGDALWAAGEREWAIVEWTNAASAADKIDQDQNLHEQLTLRGGDLDQILEEMRGSASAARAKISAAQSDRQPDISPVFRSINPKPQPQPIDGPEDPDDPIK